MKKIYVLGLIIFWGVQVQAQAVNFQWAKPLQVSTTGTGHFISVDGAGNVFTAGSFYNTTDFDPGPAVFNLVPNGQDDGFITKFDAAGNFIWAKNIGGSKQDYITALAQDASGNVYITGYFTDTADFDPGPGIFNLYCTTPFRPTDAYVCKLDNNGNFSWAKQIEGTGLEIPYSISIDPFGNIYTTGFFDSNADFDPGPGVYMISSTHGVYISKLDISGNFIWAKALLPQNGSHNVFTNSITSDATGNVYITGLFEFTVDFDPGPAIYNLTALPSQENIYLLKLDAAGNFVYALSAGVNAIPSQDQSVAVDVTGNAYVVWNNKLSKISTGGNLLWTKGIGGSTYNLARSICLDGNANIFIAGSFWGIVDFDPGPGVYNLTSFAYPVLFFHDTFILRLDNAGNFIWVQQIGGNTEDLGYSLFVDGPGNIYHTGRFSNTADFDPGPGVYSLYATSSNYIHKMNRCTNITTSTITDTACNTYTLNGQTYTVSGVYTQTISNSGGCDSIITLNLTINGSTTTSSATACDSYVWQGQTYTATGFYSDTLVSSNGCDSILNLNLTIHHKAITTVTAAICQGQNYNGYTIAGTYVDTLLTINGCDSIQTLNLTIKPRSFSNINAVICDGQNYTGHTTTGIYVDALVAANGCDSIRTLNLTVNPRAFTSINAFICEGQTYYASGANQTISGIYKDTLQTVLGCDSVVTTNLTVYRKPKPDLGPDRNLCITGPASITPGSFTSYLWQDNSTQPYYFINDIGIYWVKVTDNNNCSTTDSITIQRTNCFPIGIPNAFTPNGDSKNDIFKPTIFQALQKFSFIIFNRYGEIIFETYEYGKGWDGTFKGKAQPTGSYVYRIKFTNISGYESENNGSVLLLR